MSKRWKIFTVVAFAFIVGLFFRVSMAVVSRDVASDLGLTADELGVLSAVYFYAFALAQIPLGPFIDRCGARAIVSALGVVTTAGSLTFALAPGYPLAVAGRALLGLGTATVLMGSLKIFTNWFSPREFPRVSGFLVAAGNVGSVSATFPLAFAVTLFTWRPTFLAMTVVQALATVAVFVVVRDRPAAAAPAPPDRGSDGWSGVFAVWRMLAGSLDFWLIALIAYFWYANYMVLLALWGGPYLMEGLGFSRSQAGSILLYTSAGYIAGSFFLGRWIDCFKGSLEKTILCGQALLLLAMTPMLGPADHFSRISLAAVFFAVGLFSGSGTLIYPLARALVPPGAAATAMTCVNFFLLMGAATMQHIMGHYICSFPRSAAGYPRQAYHGAFLIPVCGLAAVLAIFCLRKWSKGFDTAPVAAKIDAGTVDTPAAGPST